MPVEVTYSELDFGALAGSGIGRMGSNDSGIGPAFMDSGSDDDYMSREERECIQFFETTLDSLSGSLELSNLSDETGEEEEDEGRATPTLSQTHPHLSGEEIIDLVKDSGPQLEECERHYVKPVRYMNVTEIYPKEEPEPVSVSPDLDERTPPTVSPQRSFDWTLPGYSQPIGAVPTPLVIAQRMGDNGSLSPTSPTFPPPPSPLLLSRGGTFNYHNGRSNPSSPTESWELPPPPPLPSPPPPLPHPQPQPQPQLRPLSQSSFKIQRFPSNINISVANREYNGTITKASVNVQERKAQVLANLGCRPDQPASESDERQQRSRLWASGRSTSFKEPGSGQARNEALSKLGLVKKPEETPLHNGTSASEPRLALFSRSLMAKTSVNSAAELAPHTRRASTSRLETPPARAAPHSAPLSPPPGPLPSAEPRRLSTTARPSGFRTPGITVQFSGRGSTDESRREALRKLGLLKTQ